MDFVMKLSDKVINVVDIDDVTEHWQYFWDGFGVFEGIYERTEDQFLLVLSFCGISIEILLLGVPILGLFAC